MGRAPARRFVEGARVVVLDIQEKLGKSIAAELGREARFVHGDIRSEADFGRAVDLAQSAFGGLDIMHHLAALPGSQAELEDTSVEEWNPIRCSSC
ncbi:MAG: SDR family oxidoreductase [Hyphomicrobiales bacterium]|nr:MAG: SDR family oxidoreductase [Hyphomicrobiales bacterium]